MRLLSPLLSNAVAALNARDICAGQKWWSGAGSNRRPSAFRGWALLQVTATNGDPRASCMHNQRFTTIDLGSRAASPGAASADSAEAISASRPSTVCRYQFAAAGDA
jgi:hypothetical protein